jgi:hypothetical protein
MVGLLARLALAAGAGALGFLVLTPDRLDYPGHYLAGFGGTLGLLALPLASLKDRLGWEVVAAVAIAVALGAVLEATVFRFAIFDPVDFANQSLGACLAGACVAGERASLGRAGTAGAVAVVCLQAGFLLAFA